MQYSFDVGAFVVALLALGLGVWNFKRQSKLEEDQDRLNKLSIAREVRDAAERDRPDFDVRIVTPGVGRYYTTINNVGRSAAYKLRLNPTKFGNAFTSQDLESFPRDVVDAGGRIELPFIKFMDASVPNIHIVLEWIDSNGVANQKDLYPAIPRIEDQPEKSSYVLGSEYLKGRQL